MAIRGLLRMPDIPGYVRKRTGITVRTGQVRYWARTGEIETFYLPKHGRTLFTTKRIIDEFIRQHTRHRTFEIRHHTYQELVDQSRDRS